MRTPVQRLSRERAGRVKYSTSCPWRRDSPSEASRAMPMCLGEDSGRRGRVAMVIFAFCSPMIAGDGGARQGVGGHSCPPLLTSVLVWILLLGYEAWELF